MKVCLVMLRIIVCESVFCDVENHCLSVVVVVGSGTTATSDLEASLWSITEEVGEWDRLLQCIKCVQTLPALFIVHAPFMVNCLFVLAYAI